MASLFEPLTLNSHFLRNRIVRSPLPTGLAEPGGFISEQMVQYYSARAAGGTGMIITEPISVIDLSMTNIPALHHDAFIPGIRLLCQAIQQHGAVPAILLSVPFLSGTRLEQDTMDEIRAAFVHAAWRAYAAGCTMIIIHGADGTLLHQVVSPHAHPREGRYAGSLAARLQLPLEIVDGIRTHIGAGATIGYRMPADDLLPDGLSLQDCRVFAKRLIGAGVALLDINAGFPTAEQQIARFPGWQVPLVEAIRRVADVPVIANGGLDDAVLAESVVADGSADLVGIGRALDDDPDWPRRAAEKLGVILS